MITELIQLALDHATLSASAATYFHLNGYSDYEKFFISNHDGVKRRVADASAFLRRELEKVPEFTRREEDTDFKDSIEPFELNKQIELVYYDKLKQIVEKALDTKDVTVLSHFLPCINNFKHVGCYALEAVKNNQNPREYI